MNRNTAAPGIFSWFGYDLPIRDRLALIKSAGFQVTSIWWGDEEAQCRRGLRYTIAPMVRDYGLLLDNAHAPFDECNDFWSGHRANRERIVAKHMEWLHDCADQQIPVLVIHLSKGINAPTPHAAGLDGIIRLVEAAEQLGVTIAVENTIGFQHLELALSEIDSCRLGLCYDSSHDWVYSQEKMEVLRRFGNRLVTTHMSDNDGLQDRHWLPGEGIIDWQALSSIFPGSTYRGNLVLEVFRRGEVIERSPQDFLDHAMQSLRWLSETLCDHPHTHIG